MSAQLQEKLICIDWVKVTKWCELTGDTEDAVYSRRQAGKWADGIHCKLVERRLWVHVSEAIEWIEKNPSTSLKGLSSEHTKAASRQ